jgi:hypothetical protein
LFERPVASAGFGEAAAYSIKMSTAGLLTVQLLVTRKSIPEASSGRSFQSLWDGCLSMALSAWSDGWALGSSKLNDSETPADARRRVSSCHGGTYLGPDRYSPLFSIDTRNGDILCELWIEGFEKTVALRPAA